MANIKFLNTHVTLPSAPVKVYHVAQPAVTNASLLSVAKTFKLQATERVGKIISTPKVLHYQEGNLNIRQCLLSGAIRYHDAHLWQVDDGKSHVQFADTKASSIATAHLTSLTSVKTAEARMVKVTHLHVGGADKATKKIVDERAIDAGVVFQRMVDGIPVEGPGGKTKVYINAAEQITGHDHYWRTLGAVHSTHETAKLVQPAAAMEQLKHYYANSAFDIEVHEIRFGYFEAGWGEKQEYLQPAYVMPLTMISGDGRIKMGSFFVISAVPNAPATIMPAPPATPKQEPRK